jgi:hypothetical protein
MKIELENEVKSINAIIYFKIEIVNENKVN